MSMNTLKIGLVQAKAGSNLQDSFDKTARYVNEASEKGAEIVCLQELFANKYFAQYEDKGFFGLAEKIPGKTSDFLSKLAKESRIALVGGSMFEKGEGNKHYNTSMIFDKEGNLKAKYRKIHIPNDPKYYEKFYFSPGNLGYVQAKVSDTTVAPLICYDQWFPEAARVNALKGAQIIFYPTAIGWFEHLRKEEPFSAKRWEDAMRSHASMNGIYVAAANRVGKEDELDFWGGSFVADPFGEIVKRASSTKEEVLIAEIDIGKIRMSQEGWGFLSNRVPGSYKEIVK